MTGTGRGGGPERLSHWEGEPVRVWETLWELPHLEVWGRIPSTNDRAWALAAEGAPAFSAVLAEEQTAGRGREGRRWSAPPGSSLLTSVLLRPGAEPEGRALPLVLGVAVARAVEAAAPSLDAWIKWPNDILVRGGKVAGILCETGRRRGPEARDTPVVVGVGVNVRQKEDELPPNVRGRAGSLELLAGGAVSRSTLAGRLYREIRDLLGTGVPPLEGPLGEELARRDVLRGRRIRMRDGPEGTARGVGSSGGLLLETREGLRTIMAGSVEVGDIGGDLPDGPEARRKA